MALKKITPQSTDRLACLVIGPAGIGKTSLIRTLCGEGYDSEKKEWIKYEKVNPEKVCVLSAEAGLLSVRELVVAGQVEGYEIGSLEDFQDAQIMCMSPDFKKQGYRWIFIDSLTEISSRCSEALQKRYPLKSDSFKMWGEYNQILTDIIKAFRDMSEYNIVFTCLEGRDKDNEGISRLVPDIAGSGVKNRLVSYFDEVLYMQSIRGQDGKTQTWFSTSAPIGMAKDRSGKLDAFEIPNLLSIQHKILG